MVAAYAMAVSLGASARAEAIPNPPVSANEMQTILRSAIGWKLTPSISAAIVANGKLVYVGADGSADLENKRAATIATRYPIGSVGSLFLAVALVQLDAKHKLRLDDPLERYMPEVPAGITLRQLLPSQSDSDEKYDALGAIIERVTGQPLLTYLTDHVFRPAGMTETWFGEPPDWLPLALGYYEWRDDFGLAATPPDAWNHKCCNFSSTARDLARFGAALFNGTLIPSSALRSLGPAFQSTEKAGMHAIGRLGSASGYDAQFVLIPRERFAMVTLANASGFPATAVLDRVFAAYYPAAASANAAPDNVGAPDTAITDKLSRYFATQTGSTGSAPTMEFLSSSESAGSTEYRYLVDTPAGTKSAFFALRADSTIDGFWVH
jgi:CubicO group peptidase (beta-lactamase class C family)